MAMMHGDVFLIWDSQTRTVAAPTPSLRPRLREVHGEHKQKTDDDTKGGIGIDDGRLTEHLLLR